MSPADAVRLRPADEADIAAIADVFLAAWQTSYREVLPPDRLAMFDSASAQELWRRPFTHEHDRRQVTVAERTDGTVVGVVTVGRDPDDPTMGHIFSLYVHPDAQGTGVGRKLVDGAVGSLVADGFRRVSLWVFEANTVARGFYARLRWQPDGATRIEADFGEPELRLVHASPTELPRSDTRDLPPGRGPE